MKTAVKALVIACILVVGGLLSPQTFADSEQMPKAPSNLTAVAAGPRQIDLSWVDNSSDETGFRLEKSRNADFKEGLAGFNVGPNPGAGGSLSLSDHTVEPDINYFYRVFAQNRNGRSIPSNMVEVSLATPLPPTNLAARAAGATRIDLSWMDNSSDESSFHLERSLDPSFETMFHVILPANSVSFSDTEVVPGATYYYRIYAVNSNGDSPSSNVVSVKTPSVPAAGAAPAQASSQLSAVHLAQDASMKSPQPISLERSSADVIAVPSSASGAHQSPAQSSFRLTVRQIIIIAGVCLLGIILAAVKVSLARRQKVPGAK